jgi:hypothetical protein
MPQEMHTRAVQQGMAERYLMQELTPAEAEEFERHYFECEVCAAAVETGEILIANAREVLPEMPVREPAQSFLEKLGIRWTWSGMLMPATAMALLAVSVYQAAVVIPGLRQPRVLPAFQLVGASRGEDEAKAIPAGATAFALTADIPPDAHFAKYTCSLEFRGQKVFALDAAPPAPGQPVTLLVPTKGLQSGSYQFTIVGSDTAGSGPARVFSSNFDLAFR